MDKHVKSGLMIVVALIAIAYTVGALVGGVLQKIPPPATQSHPITFSGSKEIAPRGAIIFAAPAVSGSQICWSVKPFGGALVGIQVADESGNAIVVEYTNDIPIKGCALLPFDAQWFLFIFNPSSGHPATVSYVIAFSAV